jgi:hypothetical protein
MTVVFAGKMMVKIRVLDMNGMELFRLSRTTLNGGPSTVFTEASHALGGPPLFSRS